MDNKNQVFINYPSLYSMYSMCPIAAARIETENQKAKVKFGQLDSHTIDIECFNDFPKLRYSRFYSRQLQ
jgi:hypothetical protein